MVSLARLASRDFREMAVRMQAASKTFRRAACAFSLEARISSRNAPRTLTCV